MVNIGNKKRWATVMLLPFGVILILVQVVLGLMLWLGKPIPPKPVGKRLSSVLFRTPLFTP